MTTSWENRNGRIFHPPIKVIKDFGLPQFRRIFATRDELADAFLHSTGADIREGHGEAYYVPSRDFISMPAFTGFKGADHFYNGKLSKS